MIAVATRGGDRRERDGLLPTGRRGGSIKTNLIIVRAGDGSLHPTWSVPAERRSWDLVVSYFGEDPAVYRDGDALRIDGKGPKWVSLLQLLEAHPRFMDDYDYIWLPDDDLAIHPGDADRFFAICRRLDLELAQPSLSLDSPATHPLMLHNSLSSVRFTNFVEAMAPCFSSRCLRRVLHTFDASQSGWGIDWLWPRFIENRESGVAIVDEVVIRHTRPLGGPNYDAMRAEGLSPDDELVAFRETHQVGRDRIQIHAVQLRSGKKITVHGPSLAFSRFLIQGYGRAFIRSPLRLRLLKIVLGLVRRPFRIARLSPA